MDIKEHYERLELNLGASNEEIKAAYKRLAIKYHPDKNNDPGAEDQFKKISESYQYLTNNNNTARQMNNMNNINNINANELFNQFFKMNIGNQNININIGPSRMQNNFVSRQSTISIQNGKRVEHIIDTKNGIKTERTIITEIN